jgi:hypothetical protein
MWVAGRGIGSAGGWRWIWGCGEIRCYEEGSERESIVGFQVYEKGFQVYEIQRELAQEYFKMVRSPGYWLIPRYGDIPTKRHRHMKQMVYKVEGLLYETLDGRREAVRKEVASSYGLVSWACW